MVNQGPAESADLDSARLADSASRLTAEQSRSGTLVVHEPAAAHRRTRHTSRRYLLVRREDLELLTSKPPFYSGNIDRQICERVGSTTTDRRKEFRHRAGICSKNLGRSDRGLPREDSSRRRESVFEAAKVQLPSAPTSKSSDSSQDLQRRKPLLIAGIACWPSVLVLAGVYFGASKRNTQSVLTRTGDSGKIYCCLTVRKSKRRKGQCLLCRRNPGRDSDRLSKIADLKVISRTSTQHYKSAPENLPEIARQLGVAHILEGSVQKSGDAVRVNVQLIKADNDSHLWADTFDRKLTDIFSVESEIAKAIADQLRAKLTGREEQVIAAKPTDNPEAYDAYLRGLAYTLKRSRQALTRLAHKISKRSSAPGS